MNVAIEMAAMAVANDDMKWPNFHEDYKNQCRDTAKRAVDAYLLAHGLKMTPRFPDKQ